MKKVFAAAAALLSTATILPAAAEDPGPDVHFYKDGAIHRGVRCGTHTPSAREVAEVERIVAARLADGLTTAAAAQIPVVFHVIHNGTEGNVPESWLDAQVKVLNAAFSASGFSFVKARVNRVQDKRAFTGCYSSQRFKQQLADDPARNLNFYTCKPKGNILGYAYLPWSYPEDDWHHGVVVLYSTLPGGGAAPYNLGDTGTHEVGHYLGLYHTFQNGCQAPGDSVDDTAFEASPAYGCPTGRNTCAQAGLDPITNFMDYTDDACMDNFTGQQGTRMQTMVGTYKPSLGQ